MRYWVARAAELAAGSGDRLLWMSPERPGTMMCTSPKGSGVNDPTRNPRPRAGDVAAPVGGGRARGSCKHQVCVNDFYPLHPNP